MPNLLILQKYAAKMKLTTPVEMEKTPFRIGLGNKTMVLGSCFADNIGKHMLDAGFDVMINPFGTLYNPASIESAVSRLDRAEPFEDRDCVEMGAGAGLVCSFEHHTSFARKDAGEFLENANSRLREASCFWKECDRAIITLGTAMVWKHCGRVVSNCLKRPGNEFTHEMLNTHEIVSSIRSIVSGHPEKEFLFTVSPVRHLGDGAHANTLSKAALQLAVEACRDLGIGYFPAYEIVCDELRDYRFYAEDLVHPSKTAIDIIWERFTGTMVPESDLARILENEKTTRRMAHRQMLGQKTER